MRSHGWLIAVVLMSAGPAAAQTLESWTGQRVTERDDALVLKVGREVVAKGDVHRIYRVEQVNGEWLWLVAEPEYEPVKGWAKMRDVVTLDEKLVIGDQAIRRNPASADGYLYKCNALVDLGRPDDALRLLDQVVAALPQDPNLFIARGACCFRKGDYEAAIVDDSRALEMEGHSPVVFINRAEAYILTGRNAACVKDAEDYIGRVGWTRPSALNGVIWAYLALRKERRDADARHCLDVASLNADRTAWPYPVIRYLRHELTADALIEAAVDGDRKGTVEAVIGLELALTGKPDEAIPHLTWAREHGNRSYAFTKLAERELRQVESDRAASNAKQAPAERPKVETDRTASNAKEEPPEPPKVEADQTASDAKHAPAEVPKAESDQTASDSKREPAEAPMDK